jgi:nucleotide-binding universal stress UspA family protein
VLAPYAQKWNADLIVLGATRTNALVRRVFGETAQNALRRLPVALYVAT